MLPLLTVAHRAGDIPTWLAETVLQWTQFQEAGPVGYKAEPPAIPDRFPLYPRLRKAASDMGFSQADKDFTAGIILFK